MKRFADIVEDVKSLSTEEKGELSLILEHILIEEKRSEIFKNHHAAIGELKSGKLKFYDKAEDVINALNDN